MNPVAFPAGLILERLDRTHRRRDFHSGESAVDDWLVTKAVQHQEKRLSVTQVLVDSLNRRVVGFYTLATGQVDFAELPADIVRRLPHRQLPVAVLAWLGVDHDYQSQSLGKRLLAQALRDCHVAGRTFPFVAVVLDCLNDNAKAFYCRWDFSEMPGKPYRLYLSGQRLEEMMRRET